MSQSPENTGELADINLKILAPGESLPTVALKDGSRVQTGTVATMLHNVRLYDAGERGTIEDELILSVPTLIKVGLFDLFSPEEWMAGPSLGRQLLGREAARLLFQSR